MADVATIRADIKAALELDLIKRSITIEKYLISKNEYGDVIQTFWQQDVIDGVVKDYATAAPRYDVAGEYSSSTAVVLLPYDVDVQDNKTRKDKIQYGDEEYIIIKILEPRLGESDLFKIVFVQQDKSVDLSNECGIVSA